MEGGEERRRGRVERRNGDGGWRGETEREGREEERRWRVERRGKERHREKMRTK